MIITLGLVIYILALIVWALYLTFNRKVRHPEKSLLYCFINTILGPMRYFKLGFYSHGDSTTIIDIDDCLRKAMKITKLSDFGDDMEFAVLYKQIMNTPFHKKQQLTNIGNLIARQELIAMFCGRLKKIEYIKKYPEVLTIPIQEPIFVTGLPRTGTTFLHRLLSLDPHARAPLLWELVNSVPLVPPTASSSDKLKCQTKRRTLVAKALKVRTFLGDTALDHIHEIGVDLPEECLMVMREEVPLNLQNLCSIYMQYEDDVMKYLHDNNNTISASSDSSFSISDNSNTIAQASHQPRGIEKCYAYYRKVLQLLSFQQLSLTTSFVNDAATASNNTSTSITTTETANDTTINPISTTAPSTSTSSNTTTTSPAPPQTLALPRWVLKCPMHMIFSTEISHVFPDAKIIWTHRHPVSAVPSLCSLLKACHQTYYETEVSTAKSIPTTTSTYTTTNNNAMKQSQSDTDYSNLNTISSNKNFSFNDVQLGRTLLKVTEEWLDTAPTQIQESGLSCQHVLYNDLIENPVQTVKNIYASFNWNFTTEYEEKIVEYLKSNQKEREKLRFRECSKNGSIFSSISNIMSSSNRRDDDKISVTATADVDETISISNETTKQQPTSSASLLQQQPKFSPNFPKLHSYEPADYGLTEEELCQGKFKKYIDTYKIPMSRN